MKVVLVDVNYKHSSTGKIVHDLCDLLNHNGHETKVLFGRGEKPSSKEKAIRIASVFEVFFHALLTRLTGLTGYFSFFATKRLINEIKKFNPDVVHLHELHGYYVNFGKVVEFLKKEKIPTVWTFHCEFMYTGKCGYAYECEKWKTQCAKCPQIKEYPRSLFLDFTNYMFRHKKRLFQEFNRLEIVTPSKWLANRVRSSFLQDKSVSVIHNGIDTDNIFYPRETSELKQKIQITKDKKVILSVAPNIMDERKGGQWVLELAKHFGEDYLFILVGVDDFSGDIPNNVLMLGRTKDQDELAQYYSLADLFLICSKRENFPTTCLEALSCGTPIVGFDEGGTAETAPPGYGYFVPYSDTAGLKERINDFYNGNGRLYKTSQECREFAEDSYSKKSMYLSYIKSYSKFQ